MKRKRTPAEKRARRERRRNYQMIFINGKQKWVRARTDDRRPAGRRIHRPKCGPDLATSKWDVGDVCQTMLSLEFLWAQRQPA